MPVVSELLAFTDSAIVLSMFMLSFIFVIICEFFPIFVPVHLVKQIIPQLLSVRIKILNKQSLRKQKIKQKENL
jgi:hypothetical protein